MTAPRHCARLACWPTTRTTTRMRPRVGRKQSASISDSASAIRSAVCLATLGGLAVNRGDHQQARELLNEALAVARETGDRFHISLWLYNLGVLACTTGDFEQARVVLEECVTVSRAQGKWSAAGALQQLGWVRHAQGQHEQARSLLMESVDLHREFEDKLGVARTLYYLGMVTHDGGDVAVGESAACARPCLSNRPWVTAFSRRRPWKRWQACPWSSRARPTQHVFGAPRSACARRSALRRKLVLRKRSERQIAAAREVLHDDAAFDRAWNEGRSMTLAEVVQYALDVTEQERHAPERL